MAVVADFTYCITAGGHHLSPPFTVDFTNTSTGSPNKWFWDFGDGSTSDVQHPSHIYTSAGPFNCKLTAFISSSTVNVIGAVDSGRKRGTSPPTGSNQAAHDNMETQSWTPDLSEPFYELNRADQIGGLFYQVKESLMSFNLNPYSSGIAELQIGFSNGAIFLESGMKFGHSGIEMLMPFGTSEAYNHVEIVSGHLDTTFLTNATDIDDAANLLTTPPDQSKAGWRMWSSRVVVHTVASQDSITKSIEGLIADFDVSSTSGDFLGSKVVGRSVLRVVFRDLTSGGTPSTWSWEKRVAGTSETEEVRAPASLPGIITTSKANIEGVTIKNITKTTTYTAGTDYNITDAAVGEITILATGSITANQRLWITYNSENAWVEFSTDQHPTHNFDKDNP